MSLVENSFCQLCQVAFDSAGDLSLHSCADIKQEIQDYELPTNVKLNVDFEKPKAIETALEKPTHKCTHCDASFAQKHNLNRHVSTVHDGKKLVICRICNKSFRDNYMLKRHQKLHTKPRPDQVSEPKTKIETHEIQDFKVEADYDFEYSDLDLSEEFLTAILKQIDELCDAINNGDPSLERSEEINQNLNNAVSCYRNKLLSIHPNFIEHQIKVEGCDDLFQNSEKELFEKDNTVYLPYEPVLKPIENSDYKHSINKNHDIEVSESKEKKTKKRKLISRKYLSEMFENVKNQCGVHSIVTMAEATKINASTLGKRLNREGITFSDGRTETEQKNDGSLFNEKCYFCKIAKNEVQFTLMTEKDFDDSYFSYLRYDTEENVLNCSLCNKYHKDKNRLTLLRHIKEDHQTPGTKTIEIDSTNPNFGQKIQDCETHLCKKLYGFCRRNLWCKKCDQKKKIEEVLCQECGKSTKCLKHHIAYYHNDKKYPCLQCDKEFKSPYRLDTHIKVAHEKLPCIHCGKLIGVRVMKRHIASQHTSNDLKKYRCDHCGKGFHEALRLKDHINIHTGEKPYKCKYCSACFASRGTHATHQKSHLGYKRNK